MNRAQLDKQPAEVAAMFDDVAARYDLTNDVLSLGQTRMWRRRTVDAVAARRGERVLDLAAGTGTSALPFVRAGAEVVAGDISEGMLAVGRQKHPEIEFVYADAMDLPFADGSFDAVTMSYGLRNVHDPAQALEEMQRVLVPGGRVVIAEFSTPTWAPFGLVYKEYLMRMLPGIAKLVCSNPEAYVYLAESIRAWPDQLGLSEMMLDAGFDLVKYRNLSGGIVAIHHGTVPGATTA